MISQDTIVALASPSGAGAIAVIRVSGVQAITIGSLIFQSISGKDLNKQKTHTVAAPCSNSHAPPFDLRRPGC